MSHPCQAVVPFGDPPLQSLITGVCGKRDPAKPMCFRGEDWCCENHHKLVVRQTMQTTLVEDDEW